MLHCGVAKREREREGERGRAREREGGVGVRCVCVREREAAPVEIWVNRQHLLRGAIITAREHKVGCSMDAVHCVLVSDESVTI
jgi:hypothetical protein